MLWAIFLLLLSVAVGVIDIGHILPKYLDVAAIILQVGGILMAVYAWFMHTFIENDDDKKEK